MKEFKSSHSRSMLVATFLLLAVLAWATYATTLQLFKYPINSLHFIGVGFTLCLILITLLYSFISQIESISLTEKDLIIKKEIGQITIHRKDILQFNHKKSILSDVRLWGISGLFGHIGLFWNKKSGKYSAFVKNGNAMLEIKTKKKCYVISCDDYNQVLQLLDMQKPIQC